MLAKIWKEDCEDITLDFHTGKTAGASILNDARNLRKQFKVFKGSYKTNWPGQYNTMNEIFQ